MTNDQMANGLGCARSLVQRYRARGMPMSSVPEAKRWMSENVRARVKAVAAVSAPPPAPSPPPARSKRQDRSASEDAPDSIDYFAERARRERAEADLAEMKAAELAGELVRAEEVRRMWSAIAGDVRTSLLQLPARLAPMLAQQDIAFIRRTLDVEIRAALQKLIESEGA